MVPAQTNRPPASYTRSYVNDVPNEPLVNVAVSGASNISCLTIEEILPGPATAVSVSGDGVWIPALNAIRWGPYFHTITTNVSYRFTGPPGSYPVNGGSWMDGQWYFSPGFTMVPVLSPGGNNSLAPPPQTPAPVFSPPSGGNVPVTVTLSDAVTNATIYYTLDGSLPTPGSTLYSNGITLPSAGVVRAVAFANGYLPGTAAVAFYGPPAALADAQITRDINTNSPSAPSVTLNVLPGTNAKCIAVTESLPVGLSATGISSGGNYVASNNVIFWGPFLGTNVQTLSYQPVGQPGTYSVQAAWSVDGIGAGEPAGTIIIIAAGSSNSIPAPPPQVGPPVFTPPSGGNVPVTVTISDVNPNASIYYTLDGSLPTSNSTLYTNGINLASAGLVRAVAFANGYIPSVAVVAFYGPPAATANAQVTRSVNTTSPTAPVVSFSVTPGTGAKCVAVTETLPVGLTATAISAGGQYIASNHVVLWGPFFGTSALVLSYQLAGPPGAYPLQAAWSVDGVDGSEANSANVVVAPGPAGVIPTPPPQEPAPVLSPPIAAALPVTVTVGSADPQSQIFYTTDGTVPTQSSAPYTGPLTFNAQTTLRARAFRSGYLASVSSVGEYVPQTMPDSLLLVRSVSGNGSFLPAISLTATPVGPLACYTVSETLLPGLSPVGLATNAVWNPAAGTISWGPFLDNHPRVLNYYLDGPSGTYPFSGLGSFDGFSAAVSGANAVSINDSFFGASPTNDLACIGEPLTYAVSVNPAPGVITVTSANGVVNWGDGTQSPLTQPAMTLQKQYTTPGNYPVTISANWSGVNDSGQFFGFATTTDNIQVLSNCNPVINSGPSDETVLAGGTAQFSVDVTSPYPASYQWYFNQSSPIVGPIVSTLTLSDIRTEQAGLYSVIVTNAYGSATSSVASLTVINPLVTGVTRNPDGSVTLSFVGLPNSTNRVFAATNLASPIIWDPVSTNVAGYDGTWQFTDSNALNVPQQFYRYSNP